MAAATDALQVKSTATNFQAADLAATGDEFASQEHCNSSITTGDTTEAATATPDLKSNLFGHYSSWGWKEIVKASVWHGGSWFDAWLTAVAAQACGNGGHCVTLWSLPGLDCVTRICMRATPQAVTIANDQILTVGTQPILSRWSFGGTLLSQAVCAPLSAFSVSVHPSGLTAVAGYRGLVDIISEFGSHLCTFCCG